MKKLPLLLPMILVAVSALAEAADAAKVVIAHRGASGYLPEHTLEAKVLAYAQGADYIEQDIGMTRDDALVVLHDDYLERVSDVRQQFPGRARADGHFYIVDFTLAEIRQLQVSEAFVSTPEGDRAVFPGRFPLWHSNFRIHTLAEELELIQGLNQSTGRQVGIYPEIKSPWFYRNEGKDISLAVLTTLRHYGYQDSQDKVFLQSFDFDELKRLHEELLPSLGMTIPLVQLIAENDWHETYTRTPEGNLTPYDYGWMHSAEGMRQLARYVEGVGPAYAMLIGAESTPDDIQDTGLVGFAHAAGLLVHPYTLRLDAGQLPAYARSFEELLALLYVRLDADGVFTDFPDRAVAFVKGL
ncbi:MAG: glycerophosphodiester phosphodiesterase [Pseudomonadales bacterium]|nr:glycerophosphodiester phosphodiesterase [Pseudomonadales bacterium]